MFKTQQTVKFCKSLLRLFVPLLAVSIGLLASEARSQTTFDFTPFGTQNSFETATNWNPLGPPGAADTARFNANLNYTVLFSTSPTTSVLGINDGDITFQPLNIGGNGLRTYTLNGPFFTSLSGGSSSSSSLTVQGAGNMTFILDINASLNVGGLNAQETAVLTVNNGGAVQSDRLTIGRSVVTVNGPTASLTTGMTNISATALTNVSTLEVLAGGQVTSTDVALGSIAGNTSGNAVVDGMGSTWNVATIDQERGNISVRNGGLLNATGTIELRSGLTLDAGRISNTSLLRNFSNITATSASVIEGPVRNDFVASQINGPNVPGEFLAIQGNVSADRGTFSGNVQFDAELALGTHTINPVNVNFGPASTLSLVIGSDPLIGHLVLSGNAMLDGNLDVNLGVDPNKGEQFTLIDAAAPSSGTFTGLPEGAVFAPADEPLRRLSITYVGGDGNDVVITDVSRTEDNFGFETGTLLGYERLGNVDPRDDSFGVTPTEGSEQARVSTGGTDFTDTEVETFLALTPGALNNFVNTTSVAGVIEGSAMKGWLTVQAGDLIEFDFNFLTREQTPDLLRNDTAFFTLDGDLHFLADTTGAFGPTASSFDEETGYQTFSLLAPTTGTVEIGFGVVDIEDEFSSSALLVDNIRVTEGNLDGDFDDDGDVDGGDFLLWQRDLGDAANLALWESNFGATSTVATGAAVPEPSSVALLSLGLLGLLRTSRQRHTQPR